MSYFYHQNEPLLRDVSLTLEPGEIVGIGGGKGSGKSTLLQIVAGALSPSDGLVRVDEINPAHYSLAALAGRIGYLHNRVRFSAAPFLKISPIRTGDDIVAKARNAAQALGLDAVIDLLPRGYSTILTDTASDPCRPVLSSALP